MLLLLQQSTSTPLETLFSDQLELATEYLLLCCSCAVAPQSVDEFTYLVTYPSDRLLNSSSSSYGEGMLDGVMNAHHQTRRDELLGPAILFSVPLQIRPAAAQRARSARRALITTSACQSIFTSLRLLFSMSMCTVLHTSPTSFSQQSRLCSHQQHLRVLQ